MSIEPSQTYILDDIKILLREAYKQSEKIKKNAFLKRAKDLENQLVLTYKMQGNMELASKIPEAVKEYEDTLQ